MNQKQIGIIIIILGVLLASFVIMEKQKEDSYINLIIQEQGGSCYLDDGTCLHDDRSYTTFIFGTALALALIIFGIYLAFFDKTQKTLAKHQIDLASALKETKQQDVEKSKFEAFLSGFSDEEQKVLKAVKEQEGIKQATLRYKTGMSKTSLSLLLKRLEEKEIVSRKPSGKTNEVYLRKRF
ncbi:MAG: MarR family transcriptional regulator [archaeon]